MNGGEGPQIAGDTAPSSRSALEKPMADLTEEDIAQVTREDCRRFLKEKGMRRPSWNKSQAIQQVISLKALLEGRPGAGDPPVTSFLARTKSPDRAVVPTPSHDAFAPSLEKKEINGGGSSPSQAEPSPYRRRDPVPVPPLPLIFPRRSPSPSCQNNDAISPDKDNRPVKEIATNQLTVVYDGRVNVYDGITPNKARAIMQLAANPENFDLLPSTSQPALRFPTAYIGPAGSTQPTAPSIDIFSHSPSSGIKIPRLYKDFVEESKLQRESEPECPTSRKASLQRYLEKRKDRFKGKALIGSSVQTSMDLVYMNQKIRSQIAPNDHQMQINSHSQPRPPQTPTQNQSEKVCFSFDLNDDACDN